MDALLPDQLDWSDVLELNPSAYFWAMRVVRNVTFTPSFD